MIVYDIDGTLLHHLARRVPWGDPAGLAASQYPVPPAVAAFDVLRALPHAFVTGRTEAVRGVTVAALRRHYKVQHPAVVMQDSFTTMSALVEFKAEALRALGASVYVGDHAADLEAAQRAGCEFVPAVDLLDYALARRLPPVGPRA